MNVLFTPGCHTLDELTGSGVGRVSTGSLLYRAALGAALGIAERIRDGGAVNGPVPSYAEVQQLIDAVGRARG